MKIHISLLVFLILSANLFAAKDLRILESLAMHSNILGRDVHFSVCLPKCYFVEKQKYPVVYLLHGLGDDETSWLEYGQISQYADKGVENGDVKPMIFVMPEGFTNYYVNDYKGEFLYQDMFVKELVPYIDSLFRTLPDRQHRALMGYSMGGFGALTLHLKYPDIFGTTVPLSISIRTDEQYCTEDASGWDQQWGRLFGEPGLKGLARITEYYKQNNPFYMLLNLTAAEKSKLCIYIDNGDKEQTLCRSNEELHILMRKQSIPHKYTVREGGHSFKFWCSALPNSLRFISDAFDGKSYRGDPFDFNYGSSFPENQKLVVSLGSEVASAFLPVDYESSNRLFPVLYFAGNFSDAEQSAIAAMVNKKIGNLEICPMILVFLTENMLKHADSTFIGLESKLRIREGYRFRAIAGYQIAAKSVLAVASKQVRFSTCIAMDSYLESSEVDFILNQADEKLLERTQFFIASPANGNFYEGNGTLHMLLRDKDMDHEYRVNEGDGGFGWFFSGFTEAIDFTANRFHK